MSLGVVVPVYNRPGLAREALESIARQTRPPHRVVIVDDASTDHTAEHIEQWIRAQASGTDWSLRREASNGGPARARNLGIESLSDCDAIAFLDSDDLWPDDYLARAERTLERRPRVVATVCDILREQDGQRTLRDTRAFDSAPRYWMVRHGAPTPSSVVVRREALIRCGGFDESMRYAEDLALFLQVAPDDGWAHMPGNPVLYRLGVGTQRSEAPALSHSSNNAQQALVRACIAEELCDERSLRAMAWYRASGDAAKRGDWAASRTYAGRALRTAPWQLRAATRWLRSIPRQLLGSRS